MAAQTPAQTPSLACPFTQTVVQSMQKLCAQASTVQGGERSQEENAGIPSRPAPSLTRADPIIFRGLKALTLANPQQESLLRLAAAGISVYCPHTALDAAPHGMCDWLAEVLVADSPQPEHLRAARAKLIAASEPLEPTASPPVGFEGAGMGRLVRLAEPQTLRSLKDRLLHNLGRSALSLAVPQGKHIDDVTEIRTVGLCPGSGAGVLLRNGGQPVADLLVTGEMSHHDALAAIERGSCVMTVFHSNSERGFVRGELLRRLTAELETAWPLARAGIVQRAETEGLVGALDLGGHEFEVEYSRADEDPFNVHMSD
ncbi:hypothetical protein KEM52_005533 [Ascosphaera acerosa]|nr:hypothetical protein KEM52_005533 [Ascosphaera acerosa]